MRRRKTQRIDWRRWARIVRDYLLITVGALIVAAGTDMFLVPNRVVSAGVTGLAMIERMAEVMFGEATAKPAPSAAAS